MSELTNVGGDHRELAPSGLASNQKVVGSNGRAGTFKFSSKFRVLEVVVLLEGQNRKSLEKMCHRTVQSCRAQFGGAKP